MNKGEIWLVEFPSTDGREQVGTRPAILISETDFGIAIVVPLTSNIQALRFPHTIEIKPSNKNGLSAISVALTFQVRAIDKKRLKKKIGEIGEGILKELDAGLSKVLLL